MTRLLAALLLLASARAGALEVPAELRGDLSVEVRSCEAAPPPAELRTVVLRVRSGESRVLDAVVRCAAFLPEGSEAETWVSVAGLDEIPAASTREAMTVVPGDAAHSECRCVVAAATRASVCEPWQALENGRCIEPGESGTGAAAPAARDEVRAALEASRALAPLRQTPSAASPSALCSAVEPARLVPLVAALVPEDQTVYVRSPWHRLDAADRAAFARWAATCFAAPRIVDAERGRVLLPAVAAPPPRPASAP